MRLKKIIDKVIRPDQTAYIPGRFIGESIRLISDILEYTEVEQMEGYMFAADIEKAFDSVDHNFLIDVLKKFSLVHVPNFLGGGRVGGLRFCHRTYHPLDFQGKIKTFCHPTLLKIRSKIIVTPPPP